MSSRKEEDRRDEKEMEEERKKRETNLVEPSSLGDLLPQPPEIDLLVINDGS